MSVTADSRPIGPGAQQASTSARAPARPASQGALAVRMLFGVTWAIDAVLKWLPGYRHTFLSQLKGAAQRQPSWLHWWFHGWISVQSHAPSLFAGPYGSGSTDVGTGIILAILFAALYVTAPSAGSERLSLDRKLVKRWAWWRLLAEPHAADRR